MRRLATIIAMSAAVLTVSASGAAPALAASGSAQQSGTTSQPSYYLALGDSLSVGIQPDAHGVNHTTNQGYADQLYAALHAQDPGLLPVKLGCSGETTATFIMGGICTYKPGSDSQTATGTPTGSQLSSAVRFLAQHRGQVSLVTVDIGANDLNGCIAKVTQPGFDIAGCVQAATAQAKRNLTTIMTALRSAGGSQVHIIGMTYYDPELAYWLTGSAGQAIATASVSLLHNQAGTGFNDMLTSVYQQFGAGVADVFTAFDTADFTPLQPSGLPTNVATICALTYECVPPPQGPNEHANAQGYAVIAQAFLAAGA